MCLEPEYGKPWWIRRVYMYQGTGVFNNATDCSIFKQSDISICWPCTWLWAPAFILASADFVEHTSASSVNEMNCRKLAARERGIFCDGAVRGDNCLPADVGASSDTDPDCWGSHWRWLSAVADPTTNRQTILYSSLLNHNQIWFKTNS